jgi:hypothetical protein
MPTIQETPRASPPTASRHGLVADETYRRRIAACRACEHYVALTDDLLHVLGGRIVGEERMCARCGCFMGLKARFARAHCPEPDPHDERVNRWGESREESVRAATGPWVGSGAERPRKQRL